MQHNSSCSRIADLCCNVLTLSLRPNARRLLQLDLMLASLLCALAFQFPLDLFYFSRPRAPDFLGIDLTSTHLPFHKFAEGTLRVRRELFIGAFFSDLPIRVDADDAVGAFEKK